MTVPPEMLGRLLETLIDHLDIPRSYYEKAAARHRSLGEWLLRKESKLARFGPDVSTQGSFRFGTVNRPLRDDDEYDLDNVCVLKGLGTSTLTQKQLKELYGSEIMAYAKANDMRKLVTEHNRCWRLQYSDEVNFHLDTLPCVPEEPTILRRALTLGVSPELAERSVAITDKRDPNYERLSSRWPISNPSGFAIWFEQRATLGRGLAQFSGVRARVEDIPPYEWKTVLQRSIQILKRHRDVMFSDPEIADLAPISMIITNLAARAYQGETDIWLALRNIVDKMPSFINPERPRVPNPADPAEDYADKWSRDARLEKSFWEWHANVRTDIARLSERVDDGSLKTHARTAFKIELSDKELRLFTPTNDGSVSVVVKSAPVLHIPSAPRPWGR